MTDLHAEVLAMLDRLRELCVATISPTARRGQLG